MVSLAISKRWLEGRLAYDNAAIWYGEQPLSAAVLLVDGYLEPTIGLEPMTPFLPRTCSTN